MKTMRQYLTVLLIVLLLIAPSAGSLMAQDANVAEVNKIVVRRWLSDVMVHGNRTAIDELVASDFIGHDPLGAGSIYGREGMVGFITSQHAMLTDFHVTEVALIAENDMISCLMVIRGRFTQPWGGLLPSAW